MRKPNENFQNEEYPYTQALRLRRWKKCRIHEKRHSYSPWVV